MLFFVLFCSCVCISLTADEPQRARILLLPTLSTIFSLSVENEQADAGRDGRTLLETKFSGADGDREMFTFPVPVYGKSLGGWVLHGTVDAVVRVGAG